MIWRPYRVLVGALIFAEAMARLHARTMSVDSPAWLRDAASVYRGAFVYAFLVLSRRHLT